MYLSQRQSRLSLLTLCVAIVILGGCTTLEKPSNTSSSEGSMNQSSLGSPQAETQTRTETAAADRSPKEQFAAILGTQQEGWLPKVLASKGLKKGLTPAATGKIIPGAEQVSEFGFSKVAVQDIPGLKHYEFYYAGNGEAAQLESVKLQFDPNLNKAYSDLVEATTQKYGAAKPEDIEQQTIVWIGSDFVTAQLTKPLTSFDGYELNISLPKD